MSLWGEKLGLASGRTTATLLRRSLVWCCPGEAVVLLLAWSVYGGEEIVFNKYRDGEKFEDERKKQTVPCSSSS